MSVQRAAASTTKSTQATTANTPLIYITYAGTATLSGLPGVSLTLPSTPASGTKYYQAEWNGSQWVTIGTTAGTISGTTLTFSGGTTSISLTTAAPLYVAVYSGAVITAATPAPTASPSATPSGSASASPSPSPSSSAAAQNVIADPSFESGVLTPIGVYPAAPVVTKAGWSQCSINRQTGAPPPSPEPFTASYTPTPSETPGAYIDAAGTSVASAPSPPPPIGNVITHTGNYAAVLGGYFYNYSFNDYEYNGVCELVTIPANATLSMYILGSGGNGTSTTTATNFQFDVDLLDMNNNFVQNLYSEFNQSDTAYRQITSGSTSGFASLAPYAGNTYQLFIGTWVGTTGNRIGFYFVDDVSLTGT